MRSPSYLVGPMHFLITHYTPSSSALYVCSWSTGKSVASSPSWICLALLCGIFAFSSLGLCFAMISAWDFSLFLSDERRFPSNYKYCFKLNYVLKIIYRILNFRVWGQRFPNHYSTFFSFCSMHEVTWSTNCPGGNGFTDP